MTRQIYRLLQNLVKRDVLFPHGLASAPVQSLSNSLVCKWILTKVLQYLRKTLPVPPVQALLLLIPPVMISLVEVPVLNHRNRRKFLLKQNRFSDTERSGTLSDSGDEQLSDATEGPEQTEDMTYRETVRSVRSFMGWHQIPNFETDYTEPDKSNNPWKGKHPRKPTTFICHCGLAGDTLV